LIFTWTGFLLPVLLGKKLFNRSLISKNVIIDDLSVSFIAAFISTFIFYLWTNFGVVLVSELYPKTLDGLIASYINAIPFLRLQLIGNLFFVPLMITLSNWLLRYKQLNSPIQPILNKDKLI
jgi:hypothetical protein